MSKEIKKICIITDLEGVAGVLNFDEWCDTDSRYYELAKEFLTNEVNAAVEGFFESGVKEIVVADGHGPGGINPKLLDRRVELMRGWPTKYPLGLDRSYDGIAWIGQHAKAGTEYAHLAHTGSFLTIDCSINGISIGEFGKVSMCASELGIRSIFATGDKAFTKEAQALVLGIETVSIKRGTTPGRGDNLPEDAYAKRNCSAIHLHPDRACELIKEGAIKAVKRAKKEKFGLIKLKPPFKRKVIYRSQKDMPKTIVLGTHHKSVAAVLSMPHNINRKPFVEDA